MQDAAAAAAKSRQSCPSLCDPIDGSPSGSSVPGILQARTLEWVAISFSNARKWKVKVKALSRVRLLATPWTAAYPAPPSMGLSRQADWSGLPLPSPICKMIPLLMTPLSLSSFTLIKRLFSSSLLSAIRVIRKMILKLSNCGAGEDSWESLGKQGNQTSQS